MKTRILAVLLVVAMLLSMTAFAAEADLTTEDPLADISVCETCEVYPCECPDTEPTPTPETTVEPSVEPTVEPSVEPSVQPSETPAEGSEDDVVVTPTPAPVVTVCETCGNEVCTCEDEEEIVPMDAAAAEELYNKLMACETLDAADAILNTYSDEAIDSFYAALSDEQFDTLDEHLITLPLADEAADEPVEEDTREIVYVTKDYTNAAPFLDPVVGTSSAKTDSVWNTWGASITPLAEEEVDNGLVVNKYATANNDGTFTLTMEAYATGDKVTTKLEKQIPTDIILVLDQSGSMDDAFYSTAYREKNGDPDELYDDQDNLYVELSEGVYAPVTVTRTVSSTQDTYQQITGNNQRRNSNLYYNALNNNLYHLCSAGTYGAVTVTRSGNNGNNRVYTYECANGCTLAPSTGDNTQPNYATSMYTKSTTNVYSYTFTYTDADGQIVTATVGENADAPNWDFYESYQANTGDSRLDALKAAVTEFSTEVANKAKGEDGILDTEDDVDHTISIVGFASANLGNNGVYTNTELFVGSRTYTYNNGQTNGANNADSAQSHYDDAPQDMSTADGVANITASINELAADGGTYVDLGIEMANGILDNLPEIPEGQERNRVVIIFTDGAPGYNGNYTNNQGNVGSYGNAGDAAAVETRAYSQIATTKTTHQATVYTVGIFTGADATSAGSNANNASNTQRANYFMQHLSSNTTYPQTPSYYLSASDSSALNNIFKTISSNIESGGSTIQLEESTVVLDVITPQFQLPANAGTSITVQVANYTGKDGSIDTFADAYNPTTDTYTDNDATFTHDPATDTVTVTGFDFSAHWCGYETVDSQTTLRAGGQKLIITVPIEPDPDFLGGDLVFTNENTSGVYVPGDTEGSLELVESFPEPKVTVPLKTVTPDPDPTAIYLSQDAVLPNISNLGEFVVGNTTYTVDTENNAYVDLEYTVKDAAGTTKYIFEVPAGQTKGTLYDPTGNTALYQYDAATGTWYTADGATETSAPTEFSVSGLTEDSYYTVTCVATSKNDTTKTTTATEDAPIYVYMPEITFKDSVVEYKSDILADLQYLDEYFAANNVVGGGVNWVNDTAQTAGVRPTTPIFATLTYGYSSTDLEVNRVDTSDFEAIVLSVDDIPVKVKVSVIPDLTSTEEGTDITQHVTFFHSACGDDVDCSWDEEVLDGDPAFLLHVINAYGDLTIIKTLPDGAYDSGDTFVFTVTNSAGTKIDVVINAQDVIDGKGSVTIAKLPIDTYTVTEDTNWSWRYLLTGDASRTVDLDAATAAEVTFENKLTTNNWLGGTHYVKNRFGTSTADN